MAAETPDPRKRSLPEMCDEQIGSTETRPERDAIVQRMMTKISFETIIAANFSDNNEKENE